MDGETQPMEFEAEYSRLKDDILFRLGSINQFELGAITALGVILTAGNVFGKGEYFFVGNIAAAAVLFGCAQCVVPFLFTVYSAHAYIRIQIELGRYPKQYRWDEHWFITGTVGPSPWPPQLFRVNHHSLLFLCLALVNVVTLVIGVMTRGHYIGGIAALVLTLCIVWPVWRLHYVYRVTKSEVYDRWKRVLTQENEGTA